MSNLNYKELFKKSIRDYFAPVVWVYRALKAVYQRSSRSQPHS